MENIDSNFSFDVEGEQIAEEVEKVNKKANVSLDDLVTMDAELLLSGEEEQGDTVEQLSYQSIVPKDGLYLGLDISKSSTGVCLIKDGVKETFNITLNDYSEAIKNEPHFEVLLRRKLKVSLREKLDGLDFDVIIIEDAFVGENPKDARMLFAINTAIDELILDNVCSTKKFLRVENSRWKSWLWKNVDSSGEFKGLNDKIRIQECLYKIGIKETGEGFQDRLDATGMLIGYFLQEKLGKSTDRKNSINWGQIGLAYELDESFIYEEDWLAELSVVRFDVNRVTKKYIREKLESSPLSLFISKNPIKLGFLGEKLGLDYIEEGGYLAFWLKKKYRKVYR